MKKLLALALAFGTIALAMPTAAHALDLASAKQQGLVGEKSDGLIGAVSGGNAEVQKLVSETNAGRMAVYKDTAAKQGIPVGQVQSIAAQKLIGMTGPGGYVMTNGSWVKK